MQVAKKLYLPLLVVAALAAGCGDKKDGAEADKPATQVAAKVNGTELTVHQVNYALQRIPNLEPDKTKEASLQVVKNLVEQELVVQKALEDKLDRDATVVQALDAARRQILSEAWMGRKLGTPAEPGDAEVSDYFSKHPELFSQRKLYRLQEISIKAPADKIESVRKQLVTSKTLVDFGAWLKSQDIPFKAAQGVKPAEQLPQAILPKLSELPQGQAMVVNTPEGLLVIVMAESQLQPVTLEQAKPAIVRVLQQQARQKAVRDQIDTLKAAAKIEYVGEFADAGKEAAAPAEAAKPADAAKPAAGAAADAEADAVSKGISGLK